MLLTHPSPPRRRPILNATKLKGFRRRCTRVTALDFVVDCSEKPDSFRSIKTTMSVTTSVKRYISSFSSRSVQNRISVAASASFSSSFVTSCRFWLAANSIWATLVVAACVTAGMRLRMINGWPFVASVTLLSTGLVIRELRRSKLRLKDSPDFSARSCQCRNPSLAFVERGSFYHCAWRHFFLYYFRSISRRSSPGIPSWFVADRSIWGRYVGDPVLQRVCSKLFFDLVSFHHGGSRTDLHTHCFS